MNNSRVARDHFSLEQRSNHLRKTHRRLVGRITSSYAAAVWIVVQLTDLVTPFLGLPDSLLPLVFILGLVGFHLVLALIFIYEMATSGESSDEPAD